MSEPDTDAEMKGQGETGCLDGGRNGGITPTDNGDSKADTSSVSHPPCVFDKPHCPSWVTLTFGVLDVKSLVCLQCVCV